MPEANIYWRDVKDSMRVVELPHYFKVIASDGTEMVAFWTGQEAREAQQWLKKRANVHH